MNADSKPYSPEEARSDPWFQVDRTEHHTTEGRVDLPMLFYDVAVRQIGYWVELDRMSPLLEGTGLVPCKFFNGKGMVNLLFFQYKDVTVGAYDEVVINLMVRPEMLQEPKNYLPNLLKQNADDWNAMAGYVLEMPVTADGARAAGRELWGYPKFVTRIPFRLDGRDFEFGVDDPDTGEMILRASGTMSKGFNGPGADYVTYTNFENKIVRTITRVNATVTNSFRGKVNIEVGSGDHRMARNLRTLGLQDKKPFLMQRCDHSKTQLLVGTPVADYPTPELDYAKPGVHP